MIQYMVKTTLKDCAEPLNEVRLALEAKRPPCTVIDVYAIMKVKYGYELSCVKPRDVKKIIMKSGINIIRRQRIEVCDNYFFKKPVESIIA